MNRVTAVDTYAYILLFITTVRHQSDKMLIAAALDQLAGNNRWYIDIGDPDKVLRVEAMADLSREIIAMLARYGFECKQMN